MPRTPRTRPTHGAIAEREEEGSVGGGMGRRFIKVNSGMGCLINFHSGQIFKAERLNVH